MTKIIDAIKWHDPREKVWGFHIHQELPLEEFSKALVIQKHCAEFLYKNEINNDADDAIKPGYGPHLDYMWELRSESNTEKILEKLGLVISYMAINRFGLSAYVHPLMHDIHLAEDQALIAEGLDNQPNAIWFGYRVQQHQDYFFNPPRDVNNKVIDTRTSRVMIQEETDKLLVIGIEKLNGQQFRDPFEVILNGFHIHMDYTEKEEALAHTIFDNFLFYLLNANLRPSSTRLYKPKENGPHVLGGWEVKFETTEITILSNIGIAIAWLMCNRQGMSVFFHPVTWEKGNHEEELKAHKEYSFFLGQLPPLDLSFFSKKIKTVS